MNQFSNSSLVSCYSFEVAFYSVIEGAFVAAQNSYDYLRPD